MTADDTGVTPGRRAVTDRLVVELVAGATWAEAAELAGCSASTVARRMRDDTFRARLDVERAALVRRNVDALTAGAATAVRRLVGLLDAPDTAPAVVVSAARVVLAAGLAHRQHDDLEQRLTALESAIGLRAGGDPPS